MEDCLFIISKYYWTLHVKECEQMLAYALVNWNPSPPGMGWDLNISRVLKSRPKNVVIILLLIIKILFYNGYPHFQGAVHTIVI